jgi:hypothetical protein
MLLLHVQHTQVLQQQQQQQQTFSHERGDMVLCNTTRIGEIM